MGRGLADTRGVFRWQSKVRVSGAAENRGGTAWKGPASVPRSGTHSKDRDGARVTARTARPAGADMPSERAPPGGYTGVRRRAPSP